MAAGGGGAWKVAYADFVTAMMAFFMVMWITAQNKQMKQAVQHYFNDPFNSLAKTKGPEAAGSITTGPLAPGSKSIMPTSRPGDPPGARRVKNMPPKVGRKIETKGSKAWAGEGDKSMGVNKPTVFVLNNGKEQGTGTILPFDDGAAELSDQGKEQLNMILPLMLGKRQKIEIRGHARQHGAEGHDEKAWQLCYARCMATMRFLVDAKIESDRFRLSLAGANEPRTIATGAETQTQNSCVDVIVLSELTEDSFGTREERSALDAIPAGKEAKPPRAQGAQTKSDGGKSEQASQ